MGTTAESIEHYYVIMMNILNFCGPISCLLYNSDLVLIYLPSWISWSSENSERWEHCWIITDRHTHIQLITFVLMCEIHECQLELKFVTTNNSDSSTHSNNLDETVLDWVHVYFLLHDICVTFWHIPLCQCGDCDCNMWAIFLGDT